MCGRLDLPDRLHERVSDNDADVSARVAVRLVGELPQVGVAQAVRRVAQMKTEHLSPGRLLRQRDVDTLLESDAQHTTSFLQLHKYQHRNIFNTPLYPKNSQRQRLRWMQILMKNQMLWIKMEF